MTANTVVLDSPNAIHNHLRCAIAAEDFHVPGVRFIACDERNEVRAHFHVSDVPPHATLADCAFMASVFAEGMARSGPDTAMVVALTRLGATSLTDADRCWFRALRQACAQHGVRLLGVHVVTPRGVREVVLDDAL